MFSKHPNGLIAAALANMGERFGFYIMMAILTLFISAKFGLSETTTGYIYSAFYASIYIFCKYMLFVEISGKKTEYLLTKPNLYASNRMQTWA